MKRDWKWITVFSNRLNFWLQRLRPDRFHSPLEKNIYWNAPLFCLTVFDYITPHSIYAYNNHDKPSSTNISILLPQILRRTIWNMSIQHILPFYYSVLLFIWILLYAYYMLMSFPRNRTEKNVTKIGQLWKSKWRHSSLEHIIRLSKSFKYIIEM